MVPMAAPMHSTSRSMAANPRATPPTASATVTPTTPATRTVLGCIFPAPPDSAAHPADAPRHCHAVQTHGRAETFPMFNPSAPPAPSRLGNGCPAVGHRREELSVREPARHRSPARVERHVSPDAFVGPRTLEVFEVGLLRMERRRNDGGVRREQRLKSVASSESLNGIPPEQTVTPKEVSSPLTGAPSTPTDTRTGWPGADTVI